jgi:hypothetical protein
VPALIHATSLIHTHSRLEASVGDSFLEGRVNLHGAGTRTGFPGRTHEDMMTILAQSMNPLSYIAR